jgi:hypothetical protein
MLENAKNELRGPIKRGLAGEVDSPHKILRNQSGPRVLDLPSHDADLVAGFAEDLRHEGLAHRHLFLVGKAAVEDLRNGATGAGFGQECFEPDDLLSHPFGLAPLVCDALRSADPAVRVRAAV